MRLAFSSFIYFVVTRMMTCVRERDLIDCTEGFKRKERKEKTPRCKGIEASAPFARLPLRPLRLNFLFSSINSIEIHPRQQAF
jgi:hypothetical protein